MRRKNTVALVAQGPQAFGYLSDLALARQPSSCCIVAMTNSKRGIVAGLIRNQPQAIQLLCPTPSSFGFKARIRGTGGDTAVWWLLRLLTIPLAVFLVTGRARTIMPVAKG